MTSSGINFGEGNRFGDVKIEGPVAGRDVVISLESATFDVRSRPDPYPGLASFTYDQSEQFGGREAEVQHAVALLTEPGAERILLPIVGASGSGKSSFAHAGVVPALEAHYTPFGQVTHWASMRPGQHPIAALARALLRLGVVGASDTDVTPILKAPEGFTYLLKTQSNQVNILVVDQLEELFTQSEPGERATFLALLQNLPPFSAMGTHIILTVRSDYLPALFDVGPLFQLVREQAIELRAMTPHALARAIRRPLEAQNRQLSSEKAWQPELVTHLATDAAEAPGLLPLLQVTLTAIWDSGRLTLDRYGTLTDALQAKAESVYAYRGQSARPEPERQLLLDILLDLVKVSLDDDAARDVRRTTPKTELIGGQADRARLIEELVEARLLSAWTEILGGQEVELVDLIHETLLSNWHRLRDAIAERRELLQRRERFRLAVHEWVAHARAETYLLDGVRLAEANALSQRQDVALRAPDGRELLERSTDRQVRRRRRAERTRLGLALAAGLVMAIATVVFAFQGQQLSASNAQLNDANTQLSQANDQLGQTNAQLAAALDQADQARSEAERQLRIADSRHLAAAALARVNDQLDLALLLSAAAYRLAPTVDARGSLLSVLRSEPELIGFRHGNQSRIESLAFNPAGTLLASGSNDGIILLRDAKTFAPVGPPLKEADGMEEFSLAFSPDSSLLASAGKYGVTIWDVATRKPVAQPFEDIDFPPWGISVDFSPDGQLLAIGDPDSARIWNVRTGQWEGGELFSPHKGQINSVTFSPDGRLLATGGGDSTIVLWDVGSQRPIGSPLLGHSSEIGVQNVVFTQDGSRLISADDQVILMWEVSTNSRVGSPIRMENPRTLRGLALNAARGWFASGGADGVRVWDVGSGQFLGILVGHTGGVNALAFSADSDRLVSGAELGVLGIWDTSQKHQALAEPLPGSNAGASMLAFSRDSRLLVASDGSGDVALWDVSRLPLSPIRLQGAFGQAVGFDPSGTRLAMYDRQRLGVWDTARGAQLHAATPAAPTQLTGPPTSALYFGADGNIITVQVDLGQESASDVLSVFDSGTGAPVRPPKQLPVDQWSVSFAFSDDGQLLAAGDAWGKVRLWDLATGKDRLTLDACTDTDSCLLAWRSLAITHDNRLLATGGGLPGNHDLPEYEIVVWDLASGKPLATFKSAADVRSVAFSPDGSLLAAGDWAGAVNIWDVATQQRLGPPLKWGAQGVESLAWSPDGRTLAAGGYQSGITLWNVSVDDWLSRVCAAAGRPLSQTEWQQAVGDSAPYDPVCPGLSG